MTYVRGNESAWHPGDPSLSMLTCSMRKEVVVCSQSCEHHHRLSAGTAAIAANPDGAGRSSPLNGVNVPSDASDAVRDVVTRRPASESASCCSGGPQEAVTSPAALA